MNSKCNKCGLVNPAGDLACRRCGGILAMPVRQSVSESKTTYPRYLFFLPFLLLAFGIGFWSNEIKKSAIAAMNVDKEEWHHTTMDKKVDPMDPKVEPQKLRDPFEGRKIPEIKPMKIFPGLSQEEMRKRQLEDERAKSQPTPTPVQPIFNPPPR